MLGKIIEFLIEKPAHPTVQELDSRAAIPVNECTPSQSRQASHLCNIEDIKTDQMNIATNIPT